MFRPAISVIVNTHDRLASLKRTMAALRGLRFDNFEIIIVHGPSTDGTQDWLAGAAGDCKICGIGQCNLAQSRNIGLQAAAGELIAFIDDDAVPEPGWLNELADAFRDREIVAAGGYVFDETGYNFQYRAMIVDHNGLAREQDEAVRPWSRGAREFYAATGTNCAFRRAAVAAAGGFDEAYAYHLEETDLQLRLMDAGGAFALRPLACVHHKAAPGPMRPDKALLTADGMGQIAFSNSYFIFQSGRDEQGALTHTQKRVARARHAMNKWLARAYRYLLRHQIDARARDVYVERIRTGFAEGISTAIARPQRMLRPPEFFSNPPRFKALHTKKPARKRLRIALLTPQFAPCPMGGIAVFKHLLAGELARRGHEISVFTMSGDGQTRVMRENDIWVHRIATPAKAARRGRAAGRVPGAGPDLCPPQMPAKLAAYSCAVYAEILRVMPLRQFDYAIASLWDGDCAALIGSRLLPVGLYLCTTAMHVAGIEPDWKPGTRHYERFVRPMIGTERQMLQDADEILASTHEIATDVAGRYGVDFEDRLHILPFGVEDRRVDLLRCAGTAMESAEAEVTGTQGNDLPQAEHPGGDRRGGDVCDGGMEGAAPADRPLNVLFVGRLEPRKGFDLVLEAAPFVLPHFPSAHFHLVGHDRDGQGAAFLARHENESWAGQVSLHGLVDDDTLHRHYAGCDVFVAPSRFESFGLIYIEAMRYGKPVIALRRGGIPSIVEDGRTGVLIDRACPQELARQIGALLCDPARRASLGAAGRARFAEKYTLAAYADRVEAFLRARLAARVS